MLDSETPSTWTTQRSRRRAVVHGDVLVGSGRAPTGNGERPTETNSKQAPRSERERNLSVLKDSVRMPSSTEGVRSPQPSLTGAWSCLCRPNSWENDFRQSRCISNTAVATSALEGGGAAAGRGVSNDSGVSAWSESTPLVLSVLEARRLAGRQTFCFTPPDACTSPGGEAATADAAAGAAPGFTRSPCRLGISSGGSGGVAGNWGSRDADFGSFHSMATVSAAQPNQTKGDVVKRGLQTAHTQHPLHAAHQL